MHAWWPVYVRLVRTLALCFGDKFSIITAARLHVSKIERLVREYGLTSKVASIRYVGLTIEESRALYSKPKEFIRKFKELGKKL